MYGFGHMIDLLKKAPKSIVLTDGEDPRILEAHACEKLHATVRTSKMGSESRTNPKLFWFIWIVCLIIPPVSNGRTKFQHVIFWVTFGRISAFRAGYRKNTTVTPNTDYAVNITLYADTARRTLQICKVMGTTSNVFDRNCISFVPPLKDLRTFVNQRSTLFHCSFGSTCGCTALLTPKNAVRSVCILNKRVMSPTFQEFSTRWAVRIDFFC